MWGSAPEASHWHPTCLKFGAMHATFLQKVVLCIIAGFLAACLWQWGIVFVTGADDALNAGYKKPAPAQAATRR